MTRIGIDVGGANTDAVVREGDPSRRGCDPFRAAMEDAGRARLAGPHYVGSKSFKAAS